MPTILGRNHVITPINWANPITKDLVFLVDPARHGHVVGASTAVSNTAGYRPQNLANKLSGATTVSTVNIVTKEYGPGFDFADLRSMWFGPPEEFYGKTAFSIMWQGMMTGVNGDYSITCDLIGNGAVDEDYNWCLFAIRDWDGTWPRKLQFYPKNSADGGGTSNVISNFQYPFGQPFTVVATYDGATSKIYINGGLDNSVSTTGSSSRGLGDGNFHIGINSARLYSHKTNVRSAAIWDRTLSDREVADLGTDPLRQLLFQPDSDLWNFGAFVGGGTTTGVGDATGSATADGYGVSKAEADGDATASSDAVGYSSAGTYGLAVGSSTAEAFGVSKAEADGLAEGSATARGLAPGWDRGGGAAAARRGGGRTFRGRRRLGGGGGSAIANPSPPAGDAIQQLLDTMASGESVRLNDRTYNMKSGADLNSGLTAAGKSIYSRQFYDRGFMEHGVSGANWGSDDTCRDNVMGTYGGASNTTDSGRLIYCGGGYSLARNLVTLMGGGHTSGGYTHGICFDVMAAAQLKVDLQAGGTWEMLSIPAPYGRRLGTAGTGTVATTNGTTAVVGTGTSFLTQFANGNRIIIRDNTGDGINEAVFSVASVADDTHLTLTSNYTGASSSGQVWWYTNEENESVTAPPDGYPPYGRDTNWPALGTRVFPAYTYPQPTDTSLYSTQPELYDFVGALPTGDHPPYALHNYNALEFDDVNDRFWVSGGNVSLAHGDSLNTGVAGGTCFLDYTTREWTRIVGALGGGEQVGFLMAPGGANYLYSISGYVVDAFNIGTEAVTRTSNGYGESDVLGLGGLTWVQNLTEVGKWDIVFFRNGASANQPFGVHTRQYPITTGQNEVYAPTGSGGTFFTGDARAFASRSGLAWCPVDGKLYVAGWEPSDVAATFFVQTVDPFQGNAIGQLTWAIADYPLTGDLPGTVDTTSGTPTEAEVYNRFRYLPDYDAFIMCCGFNYGDVYLIKR